MAQSTYATITGVVSDTSGAMIPNASVQAVETGTGYRYSTQGNDTGTYTLPQLREGNYRIRVSHPGLAVLVVEGIDLRARDVRRLDFSLPVTTLGTAIEVYGGVTLIETESARISDSKDRTLFRALPMQVRRPWDYVQLAPQVRVSNFNLIRFSGSRARQGEPAIDGLSTSNGNGGVLSRTLDYTEPFQEMRLDTAGNSAEFAPLGQLNLLSRAGSNEWHGSAFDYYETPGFLARSPFTTSNNKMPYHQMGFAIGGPLILPKLYNGKNKTFFFFTSQWRKGHNEGRWILNPTVPLKAWREGDFSGSLPAAILDPSTGQPFPGNRIPATRLSPVALKLQEFFPLPNNGSATSLTSQNYVENRFYDSYALPVFNGRVDHRGSDKSFFYVRYFQTYWRLFSMGSDTRLLPTVPRVLGIDDVRSPMISHTYGITPRLLNELRGQFTYVNTTVTQPLQGKTAIASLGLLGLAPTLPDIGGYPNITFNNSGLTQLQFPYDQLPGRRDKTIQIQDHLSWFVGSHSVKAGVQYSRYSTRSLIENNGLFGNLTFSDRFTGNTYADFLLGIPTSVARSFPKVPDDVQRWATGFFFTDEYKVSPTLTLTIGARYDVLPPWTHSEGLLSAFDPASGNIIVPDGTLPRVSSLMPTGYVHVVEASKAGYAAKSIVRTDRNNVLPRAGLAWRPFGPATVFRAGYGIYYDIAPTQVSSTGVPFVISEATYTNPVSNPTVILPRVFPQTTSGPSSVTIPSAIRADLRIPYSMQYTATLEHQVHGTAIRASYVGTNTRQGVWSYNLNQPVPDGRLFVNKPRPFPNYPAINYMTNGAGHQYHGGSISLFRRSPAHWLTYDVNYTLARDIGDLDHAQAVEDTFDRRRERAVWTDIPKHRFVSMMVYELPVGEGKTLLRNAGKVLNFGLGGWKLSTVYAYESGLFLTPQWTGSDPTGTAFTNSTTPAQVTIRPNQIGNPNISDPTPWHWFDEKAFTAPTPGFFGTAAKGVIVGPPLSTVSANIAKYYRLRERANIRFEVLANNLLNHPNYGFPGLNISNAGAVGVITAVETANTKLDNPGPRRIQFQIRLEF